MGNIQRILLEGFPLGYNLSQCFVRMYFLLNLI